MRTSTLAALCLAALTTSARADDDPEDAAYVPAPHVALGLGLQGHGSRVHGRYETGVGPLLELALGRGRWQYVVEGAAATSTQGDHDGSTVRGALGVGWLARQFAPSSHAGVELLFLGGAGGQRIVIDGARTVRPEVTLGVALQARTYHRPRLALRIDLRAVFTPDRDERMSEAGASTGFQTGLTCAF